VVLFAGYPAAQATIAECREQARDRSDHTLSEIEARPTMRHPDPVGAYPTNR